MNEVQREMLRNAGLLREVADELVTNIEAGDYCAVSDCAALMGNAMHELSRLALAADMQREE